MNILYFGGICDTEWFEYLTKKNGQPFFVAQYMFEKALVDRLIELENDICLNSIYLDKYYPDNKLIFLRKNKDYDEKVGVRYIRFINIPLIKELSVCISAFIKTLIWAFRTRKEKERIIFCAMGYTPMTLGIRIATKMLEIKRVIAITDVAEVTYNSKRIERMKRYKKILMNLYYKIILDMQKSYDGYIFFSNPMNDLINKYNKPYAIMEGIFNSEGINLDSVTKSKAIMHAGTLSENVGVKMIIDSFVTIEDKELELWLFGRGDLESYIKDMSNRDQRIKYFGFKSREEIFEYEKRAMLLINTRNPEDFYTKYSFPSKTFEYMVSGTPFITTKLDCIPREYHEFLTIIKDYNLNSVTATTKKMLKKSQKKLDNIGKNAREFILKNKNKKVQGDLVYDLLKRVANQK